MRVRKIALINKRLDADEELTKTGKERKKFFFEQYREILNAMYTDKSETSIRVRLRDKEITFIFVERNPSISFDIADYVFLMVGGEISQPDKGNVNSMGQKGPVRIEDFI